MLPNRHAAVIVGLALLVTPASAVLAQEPPRTKEQIREFLLTAEVVGSERVGRGVTQPWRLTLSDGTVTHDAAFQSVDEKARVQRLGRSREINFVDAYRYNIAAYRLAELIGLGDMMPVTVERAWNGTPGALSWWLDDVMFDEQTRLQERRWPSDMENWSAQMYRMLVFVELVHDTDRNQGNVLYTTDWKLHMIDFTRAFRTSTELQGPQNLSKCDRALFERLSALTEDEVTEATRPYLNFSEIGAVLERRDKLVRHFGELIEEKGQAQVLY